MTTPPPISETTWQLLEKAGWPAGCRKERHRTLGTPLMFAIEKMGAGTGWRSVTEELASRRVELDRVFSRNGRPTSALLHAVNAADVEAVDVLLRHGADPNIDGVPLTPLQLAASLHERNCARAKARARTFINNVQGFAHHLLANLKQTYQTPVEALGATREDALVEDFLSIARRLVEAGAEVEGCAHHPVPPLGLTRQADMMTLLLGAGADPEKPCGEAPTRLLGLARQVGDSGWDPAPFDALLNAGANPHATFPDGAGVVLTVLASSNPGDKTESIGPLLACFLAAGVDLDAKDNKGNTALMACAWRMPHLVPDLIAMGANAGLVNDKGETALDVLERRRVHFFQNQGGQTLPPDVTTAHRVLSSLAHKVRLEDTLPKAAIPAKKDPLRL